MGLVLTDERWAALAPLLEACRPKGKTPPRDLRQTIGAIVWRHANGARWRAIPVEHGPLGSRARLPPCGTDDRRCRSWWRAAQLFIRWAKLGVGERLLAAAQEGGVELGMAFLDGTSIRAHPKAAGAPKKGEPAPNGALNGEESGCHERRSRYWSCRSRLASLEQPCQRLPLT